MADGICGRVVLLLRVQQGDAGMLLFNEGGIRTRKLLGGTLLRFAYLVAFELLIKSLPCDPEEFRSLQLIPLGLKQRIPDAHDLDLFDFLGKGKLV